MRRQTDKSALMKFAFEFTIRKGVVCVRVYFIDMCAILSLEDLSLIRIEWVGEEIMCAH